MELTEIQKKAYIESGGVSCPFCGTPHIEGQSVEINAGRATQQMGCANCNSEWIDQYVLADVVPVERVK